MKTILKIIVSAFLLVVSSNSFGQQQAQFTQYMYNTIVINPGYAGNRNVLSINGVHRAQWVGLEGAPRTQTLSIHSPMGQRVGLGLSIVQDEIGPSTETYVNADFSYTIPLNDQGANLAFGLKAGYYSLFVDFGKLLIYNPTDELIQNDNINKRSPTIGAGAYVYTDKWYVGLSVPNMLSTQHYESSLVSKASGTQHVYAIGGYVFEIHKNLKFKPATMLKIAKGAPLALDVSANFLINKKFTLGTSYRLDAAISALAGFQASNQLMLGYSYDYDTTDLRGYNSGSHEFFLRYEFVTRVKGNVSPRFF